MSETGLADEIEIVAGRLFGREGARMAVAMSETLERLARIDHLNRRARQ